MGKCNITIRHAEEKSGAFRLTFNYQTEEKPASFRFAMANKTEGGEYNFSNALYCDLAFDEVSQVMSVIRGDSEVINGGKPLSFDGGKTLFMFKHIIGEKTSDSGFALGICRKDGDKVEQSQILLKLHEANGVLDILSSSMFFLAFVPSVN